MRAWLSSTAIWVITSSPKAGTTGAKWKTKAPRATPDAAAAPALPAIPNHAFNITEQGAAGDGKSLSTAAIQKVIDQASAAGGGTVLVPAGTFVSGPIKLKSNIDLHLAKGATLQMSAN